MDDASGVYQYEKIPTPVQSYEIQKRIKNVIDQINDSLIKETINNEKLLNS